jgi:hypothetical protein
MQVRRGVGLNMKLENKNLIIQFFFLFIVGWSVSLLFGNILITILLCFLLGIAFNKTKLGKSFLKQNITEKKLTQVKCNQCGIFHKTDSKFCSSCGARITKPIDLKAISSSKIYYPNEILDKLKSLKKGLDVGEVDDQTYSWFFSDIVIIDENNRYWSVGSESLKWYRSHNGEWINDAPQGKLRIIRKSDKYLF